MGAESIGLPMFWAGAIGVGIIAYAVLGGADFGAGVWLVNTRFRAPEAQKRELFKAIGPVWEANHVWILFVMIAVWNGFPSAFGDLCRVLWLPLIFALGGIVARGSAYAFRTTLSTAEGQSLWFWERVFGAASVAAPFAFGWGMGTLSSGFDRSLPGEGEWLWGWLPAFCGFYAVGLCAYLSGLYMYRESSWSESPEPAIRWRRRCLTMSVILGVFAAAGLVVVALETPLFAQRLVGRSWPFITISIVAGIVSGGSVFLRRPNGSMLSGVLATTCVLIAWMVALAPYLIPTSRTIHENAAPAAVLQAMTVAALAGSLLLVPSLTLLFFAFKRGPGGGVGNVTTEGRKNHEGAKARSGHEEGKLVD